MDREEVQKRLESIRKTYAGQLPSKISQIEEVLTRLFNETWSPASLVFLKNMVHQLVGSGATFGFKALSEEARGMESFLKEMQESNSFPTMKHQTRLFGFLKSLKEIVSQSETGTNFSSQDFSSEPEQAKRNALIYLVEDDISLSRYLSEQLESVGHRVRTFLNFQAMEEALLEKEPSLLITDIMLPEGNATELVDQMQKKRNRPLPVVFISAKADISTRLQAVRAGGYAYFTKPIDIPALLARLESLMESQDTVSHKILIIDDDEFLSFYYSSALQKAGLDVRVVRDPMVAMEEMQRFQPHLILMDLYMPSCNGFELAAVIRQQKDFNTVPILFLSSETNPEKKLEAQIAGGDDFLTKPIQPGALISTIRARLQRFKRLKEEELQKRKEIEEARSNLEVQLHTLQNEVEQIQQVRHDGEFLPGAVLSGTGGESYTIERVLGRGGMGITYSAIRTSDNIRVAVKGLLPELMSDVKLVMRFIHEARIIMGLNHPNLVAGYDFFQTTLLCYLVMEFISGRSVESVLNERRCFSPLEAVKIVLGIAHGLSYLELRSLVHRDIKPENIIIDAEGVPKLVDFGIVRMTDRPCSLTTVGIVMGTPYYISPEQAYGEELDVRSDIYSLGTTFYHMVVGKMPFDGSNVLGIIQQRVNFSPAPEEEKPDLPSPLCEVIKKMIHPKKEHRYQSGEELVFVLEMLLEKLMALEGK